MRDANKAMILYGLGFILMFLSAILYIILGTPPPVESTIVIVALALVGVLYIMLFRFHPRVQHYMEAQAEFDRNYRYSGASEILHQFLAACQGMGISLLNHDIRESQHFITVEIPQEGFPCPECGKEAKHIKDNEFECPDCGVFSGPFVFTPSNKEAQ